MKTHLITLLSLLSTVSYAQNLEAFCKEVTIFIDDAYVQETIDAKDLIESISGGVQPFTFAFYTPDGPDQIVLSCLDEGSIELEVNVIDANQKVSSCLGIIHVNVSNVAPASDLCKIALVASLDENGNYILTQEDLNLEQYCGIQSITFGKTQFNCSDISIPGTLIPVPMMIYQVDGSVINCILKVLILDESGPTITCPSNISLSLPPSGVINVTSQSLGITASGICETPTITLSKSVFTCADIGQTPVIATAILSNGNTALCQTLVTVSDPGNVCKPLAYCECKGEDSDIYIDKIWFGNFHYNSGNNDGYGDFTPIPTEVQIGTKYLFSLEPIRPDDVGRNILADVWIDWNRNGNFERNELASRSPAQQRKYISIPRKAEIGPTRMRVILGLAAPPNPCGLIPIGEVEDYTLIITPAINTDRSLDNSQISGSLISDVLTNEEIKIFPNPVKTTINIGIPESMLPGHIYIANIFGQQMQMLKYERQDNRSYLIDVSHFLPGFYYLTVVSDNLAITKPIVIQ